MSSSEESSESASVGVPEEAAPPPRRDGVALGDRPTSGGDPSSPSSSSPSGQGAGSGRDVLQERPVDPESRHVWVAPVPGGGPGEHAGLLHRWRRLGGAGEGPWWALVTYLVDDVDQPEPVQVTSWVPATMVRRASS